MSALFPALGKESAAPALCFGDEVIGYPRLREAAGSLAAELAGRDRVAVWATPTPTTVVGVVAAVLAGVPVVPLNPRSGERELAHVLADCAPDLLLTGPGDELPEVAAGQERLTVVTERPEGGAPVPAALEPGRDDRAALIVYTSGTTGAPKGVVLSRRAIAATLDDVAEVWRWTDEDVLVHALPLFHVHGLVLGALGPLRRGGTVRHLGRFSVEGVTRALTEQGGTMVFGVPTMYHRLAEAAGEDAVVASALRGARLLVSGSAALPPRDHERIRAAAGARVIERYGMTETLMNTSTRVDGPSRPGTVGVPLPGVDVRLVDERGERIEGGDGETVGELQVRGPSLFTEYLNRPDATAEAFDGGWFRTGDMATRDAEGYYRIVGRSSTDVIKSGGYKIGAGEIENVLLECAGVREAAVTGEPDPDLGERVVAWIVPVDGAAPPDADRLAEEVSAQLSPHKRPRVVRFVAELPRNDMGKVMKRELG
ncbi:AMP-binding protein [Streptomyces chumphonensis]|uniref:Acyl-CoA synthetase n=1 Tax=Streptomyces chumphonensis TaxID=1214925 RepID=A0A927EW09_9ACTN|nr:acyl-CoA synthetase [Streptomyces chumphonensis]MBD3931089.1 acyl-CoA synthetase [Streptomyces chumphonensis]